MNKKYFNNKFFRGLVSIFLALVFWEVVSRLGLIDELFISSPLKVFLEGISLMTTRELWLHIATSMEAVSIGYFLAVVFGVLGGLFLGSLNKSYDYFRPHIFALSALPMVAIMPLVIIWFGIGLAAKSVIIFLMAVTPILINTIDGVKGVDKSLILMARSFGASRYFLLINVVLFQAMPAIFSGMRIAVGRSMIALIISEAFGFSKGLGYLVVHYGGIFQTARLLFVVAIMLGIALLGVGLVSFVEKKIIHWK